MAIRSILAFTAPRHGDDFVGEVLLAHAIQDLAQNLLVLFELVQRLLGTTGRKVLQLHALSHFFHGRPLAAEQHVKSAAQTIAQVANHLANAHERGTRPPVEFVRRNHAD